MCVTWLPPDGGWDPMIPGGPVLIDHVPEWHIDDVPQEDDGDD